MIDREQVIKAFEECQKSTCSKDCPYYDNGIELAAVCEKALMRDALALLKEQEVSPWISVKNRLPEESGYVLVRIKLDYADSARYVETCHYSAYKKQFGCFDTLETSRFPRCGVVTHWMPLPEPPKEEDA